MTALTFFLCISLEQTCEVYSRLVFDVLLNIRVASAVNARVSIRDVEKYVGTRPVVNTHRDGRNAWSREYRLDSLGAKLPVNKLSISNIAFWRRPLRTKDPLVVGIIWFSDGTAILFKSFYYSSVQHLESSMVYPLMAANS